MFISNDQITLLIGVGLLAAKRFHMFLVITIRIYFSINAMSKIWHGIGMEVWKVVFHSIFKIFHTIFLSIPYNALAVTIKRRRLGRRRLYAETVRPLDWYAPRPLGNKAKFLSYAKNFAQKFFSKILHYININFCFLTFFFAYAL